MSLTTWNDDTLTRTIEQGAFETVRLSNGRKISCLKLSPDCQYLAIGDVAGIVTIRRLGINGKKLAAFDAGSDTTILHIVWHPSQGETVFVCSGNGFINCVNFHNVENESPLITSVRVLGWASAMAVNDSATQIAVSHDNETKIHAIPFPAGPSLLPQSGEIPTIHHTVRHATKSVPAREHSRPTGVHYLSDEILLVSFFARIVAYSTATKQELWSIRAPEGSQMASCSMSPSKQYLVATNLHSGLDWYSLTARTYLSSTQVDDVYAQRNYRLPVVFLTESSVAAGHNYGYVVTASRGVDRVIRMGKKRPDPSQVLTGVAELQNNELVIASGHETDLIIRVFRPRPPAQQTQRQSQQTFVQNTSGSRETSSASVKGKGKEESPAETQLIPPDPQAPSSSFASSQATLVGRSNAGSTSISASSSKLPLKRDATEKEDDENPPDPRPRFHLVARDKPTLNKKMLAVAVGLLLLLFLVLRPHLSPFQEGQLQQTQPGGQGWLNRAELAPGNPVRHGEGEYYDGDEDDDLDGCSCEDPILITETKVVTVTKAVTTTVTVEKPRRTGKGPSRHK